MSRQVLRSKKLQFIQNSYFNNITAGKTYIANNTEDNFIVDNGCNSISIVSSEYDINYTQTNSIIIGQDHTLNTNGNITVIGSNFTINDPFNKDTISIGNNNSYTNSTDFVDVGYLCIGNNNLNIDNFKFVIGNNNNIDVVNDPSANGIILGSENSFTSTNVGFPIFIGNNNICYDASPFIIGNSNQITNFDEFYFLPNCVFGQDNQAVLALSSFIGNSNICRYVSETVCIGSYNSINGAETQDMSDSMRDMVILGNCNGQYNGPAPSVPQRYAVVIGNKNMNNTQIFSKQIVVGRNNTIFFTDLQDLIDNGHNSVCLGNNNRITERCVLFGSGCKTKFNEQIIFNTFSVDYDQVPFQTLDSRFIVNCPFGSNISTNPNDRNKLFYDQTNKKLFYNLL